MMSSLSDSSIKQYDSCLKKWWSFYLRNNIDMYEPNIPRVIEFIAKEFGGSTSVGTHNSCSAIALLHLRPAKPKYGTT